MNQRTRGLLNHASFIQKQFFTRYPGKTLGISINFNDVLIALPPDINRISSHFFAPIAKYLAKYKRVQWDISKKPLGQGEYFLIALS
jgi:hypothetical protein